MPGSEWSRLVAEPTATELDAALAEVRVRAVPIARRNARNAQATKLMVGALLVGGSFVAGRAYANGGVSVGEQGRFAGTWKGMPEMVTAPDGMRQPVILPVAGPTVHRFHITTWTEWDGERFGEAEGWVEGPPGVSFNVRAWFLEDSFNGRLLLPSTDATTGYFLWADVTRRFGASPRGLPLTETGWMSKQMRVPRGQPVLIYPFGRGGFGEPTTVIRIEGPDLSAPPGNVPWELPDASVFYTGWGRSEAMTESQAAWMRSHGVRTAITHAGSLTITPAYQEPPTVARLGLVGRSDSVEAGIGMARNAVFELPGVPGKLRAYTSTASSQNANTVCIHVMRANGDEARIDAGAGKPALRADGCAPFDSRFTPFETMTNQGQRLRVQFVRLPGVNF